MRGVDLSLGRGAARVHILRDVDLTIGKGEAVGIIGASGSGKSTLLMIMAGLERPDKGEVEVDGVKLGGLNAKGVRNRDEARARAEALRPTFVEFAGMSANAIAAELNARNVEIGRAHV